MYNHLLFLYITYFSFLDIFYFQQPRTPHPLRSYYRTRYTCNYIKDHRCDTCINSERSGILSECCKDCKAIAFLHIHSTCTPHSNTEENTNKCTARLSYGIRQPKVVVLYTAPLRSLQHNSLFNGKT